MDKLKTAVAISAALALSGGMSDALAAQGRYVARCYDKDGNLKWEDHFDNLVTTLGANDMLDKYLAGSNWTGAFYMGLISSTSYGAGPAAGDTAASHAGWAEAGGGNAPAYSATSRPAVSWATAAARSKAMASAISFTFTSPGTIKGSFLGTNATKDGTAGLLFSAGLFSGGDKVVAANDVVQVSYSLGL